MSGITRRAWAFGTLGLVVGAGGAQILSSAAPGRETRAARGSLEWALQQLGAPDREFMDAAGDLERVSLRHRDPRLAYLFARVLDVAIRSDQRADMAACCAVRSLARLDRADILRAHEGALRASQLADAVQELTRVLATETRRR